MKIPALETYKIINDPIHGYIPLTKLEYEILQLPVFNRLHDLKQLSMAYLVFPSAVSTRFIHSLGAMFLASKMIYQLVQSMEEKVFLQLFPNAKSEIDKLGIIQTVRLGALLHDIGHGPFSHATEDVMSACLKESHSDEFTTASNLLAVSEGSHVPIHEYYSYMLTKSEIAELIGRDDLRKMDDGNIIPVYVDDVICLFAKNEAWRQAFCTKNGLAILRKIVSSQLDADRMDYLVRDAYASAVPYGLIDVERIIMNLFVRRGKVGDFDITVHERALASVEDMLDARFKMYKWLIGHHMVVATGELLRQATIALIENGKLDKEDFYWKKFASDQITDTYIMDRLISEVNTSIREFKGIVDRRYLPVSLLKRPSDHIAFYAQAIDTARKDVETETLAQKLPEFIDKLRKNPIIDIEGESIRILTPRMPRSPYSPLKETVWICMDKPERMSELIKASNYFRSINNEWMGFPSYYISYIISGKTKKEASNLREKVTQKIVQQLAELI
jgi:hypothetical protein